MDKSQEAFDYAKKNKDKFLSNLTINKHPTNNKVAILMAGSPGAGKSEVATSLSEMYPNYVIIDADNFRKDFPDYNGSNSSIFQKASSWLVEQSYRLMIQEGFSFILDATLAQDSSNSNTRRALHKGYEVTIFYVYQDPYVAWNFAKKREGIEGRLVPKSVFINSYFKSKQNVIRAKNTFPEVQLNVVLKDFDNNIASVQYDAENIDLILPLAYTEKELEEKLND